jgi:hypothetical protein
VSGFFKSFVITPEEHFNNNGKDKEMYYERNKEF